MIFFCVSSRGLHTSGALVTGVQTFALPIFLDGTQFLALYRHYGAKVFDRIVTEILDHTERDMVERLKNVRSGKYAFEDYLDDAGPHTDPIKIAVDIEITDKEARLDFSRSSDQVAAARSEEHTSELQSLMRLSYAVFCLKKKKSQYNDKT